MSRPTKIVVWRLKEVIYTILFILLGILLVLLAVKMFTPGSHETAYVPGIYSTCVVIGDHTAEMEVTLDAAHIKDIRLVHKDESLEASYPLVSSAMEELTDQIIGYQSAENISISPAQSYTGETLLYWIRHTLNKGVR